MFEPQHTTPWYRSSTTLLFLSILLPPVGLVLLWLQAKPLRWKVMRYGRRSVVGRRLLHSVLALSQIGQKRGPLRRT